MRCLALATSDEDVPPTAAALWRYAEELVRAGVLWPRTGPRRARGAGGSG